MDLPGTGQKFHPMTSTTRRALLTMPLGSGGAAALVAASTETSTLRTTSPAPPLVRTEPVLRPGLFQSFFMGGFECSTHWRTDGRRHDLLAATRHDVLAEQDYRQLAEHGIHTVRDGIRWHLIEAGAPGRYDWSSVLPMLRAGQAAGTQVIWDLCHYGWPDGFDVFSSAFVDRFERFAGAFARLHVAELGRAPMVCPVNEMSFLAWAGGEVGIMNPDTRQRGVELKRQLVRATIAATHAVRAVAPEARLMAIDPLIHLVPRAGEDPRPAKAYLELQFQAWDMLAGRYEPGLGGAPGLLDVIGVNYYANNQEEYGGATLAPDDPRRRPLRAMLADAYARYQRPIFLAETSTEGDGRAAWLRHVGDELRAALQLGVPVEGACLYPVLSHPGWDDDRYCPNGLLEMEVRGARRVEHTSLADELRQQQALLHTLLSERSQR
jgi:hypothetical protein